MLDEAFNKYKNGKEITEAEFRLLIEEFNQNVPLNKTTPIK
jgi:hypothetical protein